VFGALRIFATSAVLGLCASYLLAQPVPQMPVESPILTIDSERLFEESDFGRRTIEEIEARGAALAAENRQIEEELVAEEKELTALRPTMEPADFRNLADAFDAKVQEIRRTQDRKTRELNNKLEERRVVFLNASVPVLEQLMREAGAAIILERRSVFISSVAVDVTRIAIERLDLVLKPEETEPKQ
jgi:Skp family chaperone for outer membrane proteins